MVHALAGALLLEPEAIAYLRDLAGPAGTRPRRAARREYASPGLLAMIATWPQTPALIYDRSMDLLATNPLGEALFSWLGDETNLLRGIFLRPQARTFYRDWARIAEGCVAAMRTADTDTAEIKHFDHEVVGRMSLRFENLTVSSAPGQHLVAYHADPGSPEADALALPGSYPTPASQEPANGHDARRRAGRPDRGRRCRSRRVWQVERAGPLRPRPSSHMQRFRAGLRPGSEV
ncbi:MmyB family transcriptional regulator [Winogradskya humida]|uniref:MmyB-like transcription regulator ligand binding domain-containing protein n=1 Tax=Winogradskya humida TaxID=113566 RepID=A0ABQ4A0X5_9ACTN|nr:hypothetical protein [Actinoplanes humidus]GIE24478.1 hypothetical protein Ahu01nite_075800 [Actinoplanes humidus]